ncbi:MAG: YtxH domain-containing protein [Patescibacteria group bacterium]
MGHKAGKIALGFGLITGAFTGLLFAPDEGKNLRSKIAKGDAKGLLKDLESMGSEMKDMVVDFSKSTTVQEALDKAKDKAADVANMKRTELDAMLTKANQKAEEFKSAVAKYVKEQKAVLDERMAKKSSKKATKKPAKKSSVKKPAAKKPAAKKTSPKKKK